MDALCAIIFGSAIIANIYVWITNPGYGLANFWIFNILCALGWLLLEAAIKPFRDYDRYMEKIEKKYFSKDDDDDDDDKVDNTSGKL